MTTTPPTGQNHAPPLDTAWAERPPLGAAMYNPALIACLLCAAAGAYKRHTPAGMPLALSFVIVPLALHRGSRDAFPATTSTHLSKWVERHPVVRTGFPDRAQALVDSVRQGLRFALRHRILELHEDALLPSAALPAKAAEYPELDDILRIGRLLGRWLAKDDTATVFALLGVAP
ncbi:three component ABC system middle component [Streptomyces hokutonensis]|uniref:three component ABC system middle component n=1 Tax=Streptomyces hokutonensis TaxID=1306990 RepID=UPI003816B219